MYLYSVRVWTCFVDVVYKNTLFIITEQARELFKETVNSIAVIRQEEVSILMYLIFSLFQIFSLMFLITK